MQTFLSNLVQNQSLAHVVHIGAGTGVDLPVWRKAGARAITLIEGDAEVAEQLEAQTGADDRISVVQAVVSGDLRERAFRRMNFPDLNSLRAPTGLKELFPGLKTLSKELVQPVDPARLVAPLDLPDEGSNLLVIEAPGEALGILKALAVANLLLRFDMIHLTEAREPLYSKAPPAADIAAYLVEVGFVATFEDNPVDPERPCLTARFDRAGLVLRRRFEEMTAKLAQAEASNAALSGELEGVRAKLTVAQGKIAQVSDQLTNAQREAAQRAEQVAVLRVAREEMDREMLAAQAEAKQVLRQATEQAAQKIGQLNGRIEKLNNRLAQATGQATGQVNEPDKEASKEAEYRLGQARDEMLKAEGQINLIRDLLLHGPHL